MDKGPEHHNCKCGGPDPCIAPYQDLKLRAYRFALWRPGGPDAVGRTTSAEFPDCGEHHPLTIYTLVVVNERAKAVNVIGLLPGEVVTCWLATTESVLAFAPGVN